MSMEHKALYVQVEEEINAAVCTKDNPEGTLARLHKYIEDELKRIDSNQPSGFYADVCAHMTEMRDPSFIKPEGSFSTDKDIQDAHLDTPAFYLYAYIGQSTWSNMRKASQGISKETGLKLVIALQLTLDEARRLLQKASLGLSPVDYRDQVVAALLNIRCYDPDLAKEVLDKFGENNRFQNIYSFACDGGDGNDQSKERWYQYRIEEELNAQICIRDGYGYEEDRVHIYREVERELREFPKERSLYDDVCYYIRRIKNPRRFVKSDKLDKKGFYDYAWIGRNTWSNFHRNKKGLSKDSALKLVIALQLSENEANALLEKASLGLNPRDRRDQIILALLRVKCYDPYLAASLLEEYSKQGSKQLFDNIYDIKKMKISSGGDSNF